VGLAAFSGCFLAGGWFRQSGVVSSHPPAGNAHRWAFLGQEVSCMLTTLLTYFLFVLSGILLNMGFVHLLNYSETIKHPIIAKTKNPKLSSTLWGLGYLFAGGLILLLKKYHFDLEINSLLIFIGFSVWAIFLAVIADRADRRRMHANGK
jgi:uncharacterized membrane protein